MIATESSNLHAPIEIAEKGIDVLAVGKRPNADAHTELAAGGINAVLATVDREDSRQPHAADTLSESGLVVCLLRLWFRERSSR